MVIAYPYKFSDWYGYDKDCVPATGFSCTPIPDVSRTGACADTSRITRYFTPSAAGKGRPTTGDNVWQDANGTIKLADGFYRFDSPNQSFQVNTSGVVINSIQNC
mgnify:FL=1